MAMNFVTFNQDYSYLAVGKARLLSFCRSLFNAYQLHPRGFGYLPQTLLRRAMRPKMGTLL